MAKSKKQKLSVEELLEQALVPEKEQPYEVPMNWVWTKTGKMISVIMGQSPKGEDNSDDASNTGLIGGASDMGELYPYVSRYTTNPTKLSKENDVIVSIRATLGRPIFSDGEYCLGRGVSALRSDVISGSFIRYFVLNFEDYLYSVATGTTFAQVSKDDLERMPLPLPPIAEQQRIVHRIDSMFAKLDQAKELAENALDSFETRKAAILHKAFTGELTAKWRVEHSVGMDSWENKKLNEVAKFSAGYAFKSKSFTQEGYQVIRMGNLYNGILDLERNPVFIDPEVLGESLLNKSRIEKGDILLTLTGTKYKRDYGYAVLIDQDQILLLNQRIVALKPNQVDPIFLLYFLRSNLFRDVFFSNETGGVNQGNVRSKFVENILMPYPSLHEQKQIVSILVNVLSKEDKTKELIDVIDQIDGMKKAILARAFRGELGTNDATEGSSVKLLIEALENKINESETVNKGYPKNESFEVGKVSELDNKDLLNVLNQNGGKLTPLELYKKTEMEIEEFYAVLKEYVGIGDIIEDRKNDGEVYLVAKR
ncbi:restriction endonuclease subunit S [Paenibacillus tuaregi]|uniref:restriction endonuclease subunit S n=1 Tax=Paenibacillus tuaregi TaxID=1816681 RepID=UPI0008389788|nr:restriction endonuclease subunit S [Paenibacillus tuaregi]